MVLSWYLPDEATPDRDAIADLVADAGATVPSLWRLEIANAFRTAVRKGRLTLEQRNQVLTLLDDMNINSEDDTHLRAWSHVLPLADKHGLTPYDATYLELAIRKALPLATLDAALAKAARDEGLSVLP